MGYLERPKKDRTIVLKKILKYGVRIRTGFIWHWITLNTVINLPRFEKGIEFLGQTNDARLLKASDLQSLLVSHSARRMVKWNLKRH